MSEPASAAGDSARTDLLKKFGWTSLGSVMQMMVGILSVVVLTRFLSAQDYGLFGIALISAAVGDVVTGGVLASQLEQAQKLDREHSVAIFWANLVLAVFIGVLMIAASMPIASALGAPDASLVIIAMAGLMVVTATGVVPQSIMRRNQQFRALSKIGMLSMGIGLITGVGFAIAGAGVWALVAMEATRRALQTALSLHTSRWCPAFSYSHVHFREMLPFNAAMLLGVAIGRADRIAPQIAATLIAGPAALGLLNVALRIGDQIQAFIAAPIGAMALPVLSGTATDRPTMHRTMEDAWRAIAIVSFPCLAGLAAISPVLIPIAVGVEFQSIGVVTALIVLANLRVVSSKVNIGAIQAAGKALVASASLGASFAAHLVCLLILAPLGILGIAAAAVLRGWLTWPLAAWLVKSVTGFGLVRQAAILLPPLTASLIMAALVYMTGDALAANTHPVFCLAVQISTGAAIYIAALLLLDPWARRNLKHILRFQRKASHHAG